MRLGDEEETENRYGNTLSPPAPLSAVEAASELQRLLEQERRHTDYLTRALHEAEVSLRRMEDVLATASHDLKSPLGAILLNVQSILHAREQPPPLLRTRLQRVEQLVRQSAQLISDILAVERGDSGTPPPIREPIDLKEFVHQSVLLFKEQLDASGCTVLVSGTGQIQGLWDRTCLTQIVNNLVSNAIKYGNGKPFEIAIACNDDRAWIVIADHGIGLAAADRQRVFQRFEQLRPTDPWRGSGLGLWIVTKAVDRMGGSIRLQSAPGGGTTFIVELPLHLAP